MLNTILVNIVRLRAIKQRLPLVDSWSRDLDYINMYPDRDTTSVSFDSLPNPDVSLDSRELFPSGPNHDVCA